MTLLLFILGLVLLVGGAEVLIRGAVAIADRAGIPPLVIGLTVVAFGTSAPELAVSLGATLTGAGDLAIGNVVGSNIFNVLMILGAASLVAPLMVDRQVVREQVPLVITLSVVLLLLALDGAIGRGDGVLLTAGILGYTSVLIVRARRSNGGSVPAYGAADPAARIGGHERAPGADSDAAGEPQAGSGGSDALPDAPRSAHGVLVSLLRVAAGLVLLVLGSRFLVQAATTAASAFGVSDLVIGLTVVAAGTSLPELATSIIASLKGERDIAVGNIMGSNVFNILAILGVTAALSPGGVPVSASALAFDIPVMIVAAVVCLPIFAGQVIERWEGALLLGYYIAYTTYLVLNATGHHALPEFRQAMLYFILPLTLLTLLVLTVLGKGGDRR